MEESSEPSTKPEQILRKIPFQKIPLAPFAAFFMMMETTEERRKKRAALLSTLLNRAVVFGLFCFTAKVVSMVMMEEM